MRPPVMDLPLGPRQLNPIAAQLDQFAADVEARASRSGSSKPLREDDISSADKMTMLGNQLLDLLIPRKFHGDLRKGKLFLEIGMDEALLDYPWELMHDGDDFLCMKHYLGRFVNAAAEEIPSIQPPKDWVGSKLNELSVLVISVPEPERRTWSDKFERLPGAESETKAIVKTLGALRKNGVRFNLLEGKAATYNNVYNALKNHEYHIIHFSGHAKFDDVHPSQSGLALYNQDMSAGEVVGYFSQAQPVLCFMNACETGRTGSPGRRATTSWKSHHNIFGLAKAFLMTGTYLLGSRWELGDKAAAAFATKFYSSLLGDEKSIGRAITEARRECKDASPKDQFSWASYVYYGDPRLQFRRAHEDD